MITEISVCMTVGEKNSADSVKNWIACINQSHDVIFDWFNDCIHKNIIHNQVRITVDGVTDTTTYFASDVPKANLFANQFRTHQLDFSIGKLSMQQFWNHFDFDIKIEISECQPVPNETLLQLIDTNTREIWNTKFPLDG